jgi:hypothetical protein
MQSPRDFIRATALLCLKAFEITGVRSPDDIASILQTGIGKLAPDLFHPSRTKRARVYDNSDARQIIGDYSKHDVNNIFYGATVVFTGTLSSMTRGEAQQLVADIGGNVGNRVTKNTDYLIVGQQDFRLVGDDGMSGKQEKAVQMKAKGHSIEMMSEADFLSNIEGETRLAVKLALKYAIDENIPARYRKGNKSGGSGKAQEGVEYRFSEEVKHWEALVLSMIEHLGDKVATRYLTAMPIVNDDCQSITGCADFVEFNAYVQRRRDLDICSDEELGLLSLLLTELQRTVERRI